MNVKKSTKILIGVAVLMSLGPLLVVGPAIGGKGNKPNLDSDDSRESSSREHEHEDSDKDTVWQVVEDVSEVKTGDMVGIQAGNGKWLSRAYDTEGTRVELAEKIWQVRIKNKNWSFKSWAGTYLGLNRETKMVAQARTISSEVKWNLATDPSATSKPRVTIKGVGRDGAGKYAGLSNKGKADLSCKYESISHPTTTFTLYKAVQCNTPTSCWDNFIAKKAKLYAIPDVSDHLGTTLPLFGSPKPFNKSSDSYNEATVIFKRTLEGWGRLADPVKPLFFMESADDIGQSMVKDKELPMLNEFEHHKEYKTQPTYRGLFAKAFKGVNEVLGGTTPEMAVYSNSDILYTSNLATSLAESMKFAKKKYGEAPRVMVVGQRVNVVMPETVNFGTTVDDLDRTLKKLAEKGQTYQTNAEDYFAVSRELYNWEKLPDFIIGGVAFDNWFVGKANRDKGDIITVDATDTVLAVHQNHGQGRKDSHLQPKSQYNRNLAVKHGSWSKGRVVDTQYATMSVPWGETVVVERRRLLF
eukprot:TRINITY_DN1183_c3_g1_i2.p1 TRINITY_DN1183_c3_g1~~TRINITY_DN1183_c3_g1_i2.p1  ORF type:complete len:526 (+),score=87.32 TRINITY_DN1183_c3_g1_i2:103-1680(+)